ncbi:hypothetical protein K1719_025755 [Acacia pycnantha]|nr:hypothetical protein K1719_025755 [Acacia pycnantha]
MENEVRDLKLLLATRRCAKAALLLSNLKSLPSHTLDDNEMLRREIEVLKVQLAKQRLINKRIKLCALSELIMIRPSPSAADAVIPLSGQQKLITATCILDQEGLLLPSILICTS